MRLRRRSPDFTAQRSRRLAAPGRRGRARGAREHGSVHGQLGGGVLTLRRARAPASKPRWRRPAHSARPPWPAAVASVSWREKTGRERMNARVRGSPPSPVLFARRARAAVGFRSDGEGRRGGERARFGTRGARRRAGLAAWPSAVGPNARAARALSGPG